MDLLAAAATGYTSDFLSAAAEDGLVLGVGFGGLLLVLAREILVDGAVESAPQCFTDALFNDVSTDHLVRSK
jgi:hypothetical protein